MLTGNAIIGQSGGPTAVINNSLAGVINEADKYDFITGVYGMRWGIEGFLQENIIDLQKENPVTISGLRTTPSSALGSCRHKLKDEDLEIALDVLKKYNIRYMFLIGGNDTMDTIHRVEKYCKKNNYDLVGIGIPKTVDNDLAHTDHTPGFPSAARYVAISVRQEGVLARDMQKVDSFAIFQTIGRDSGWLAAASIAVKETPEDAPHLIYLPEVPFDDQKFLADFEKCHRKHGWVSIVVAEGVRYADNTPITSPKTKDRFGHVELGAMAGVSPAMKLHKMISEEFGLRGEFEVTESLQMCGADRCSEIDVEEAYRCGVEAVKLAAQGKSGVMVTLVRDNSPQYHCSTGTVELEKVALEATFVPEEFITESENMVTQACCDYVSPLIGELPRYSKLECIGVIKKS